MLKIKVVVVDRTKSSFIKEGEIFYLNRLRRYSTPEWLEVKPASPKKSKTVENLLDEEGESITKTLLPRDYVIALDKSGEAYDSEDLAARIQKLSLTHNRLSFVIGGPLGLSTKILTKAQELFSLSKLTLTHEMSRLLLLEQLYRAFTILNNEKYHK